MRWDSDMRQLRFRAAILFLAGLLLALPSCAGKVTREQPRADASSPKDASRDGRADRSVRDATGAEDSGLTDAQYDHGGCSTATLPPGIPRTCGYCYPGTVCCAPHWCNGQGCPAALPQCVDTQCYPSTACPPYLRVQPDDGGL